MRLGYSATVRALWLSVPYTAAAPSLPFHQPCLLNLLTSARSLAASYSSTAHSQARSPSARRRCFRPSLTISRFTARRTRRRDMSVVYSLSAETSLIFLEHYTTRLTRSKLQCAYAEHQPTPSFSCTLSISIPTTDSTSASAPPTLLSCTSPVSAQKKVAKAAAALMLCRQLIEKGEFEPFAVSGQPDKFAFSSKREKRFQAARSQPKHPVDFAVYANKQTAVRYTAVDTLRPVTAPSLSPSSSPTAGTSAKERPRNRMVLLSGLDVEEQLTAATISQRLSTALAHAPTVHPFQSATHPHNSAYLLHFNSAAEAEEAVILLDGREDVVTGQRLIAHRLDKSHETMMKRAWYPPPQQLTEEWLRVEDDTGADHYYFYAYSLDLFDDGRSPYSLVLFCPAALPVTQPLMMYPPLAPSLTADEYANQQPRQFDVRYAGRCRLSVDEMGVATTWWASIAKGIAKRGDGEWCQEQRRYLVLPVLRDAAFTAKAQQPVGDDQLISSFAANHANHADRAAHLTPDWKLINQCLCDTSAVLSYAHYDADHRTLSSVILTTPHNGVLYLPHRLSPTLTAGSPFPHPRNASGDQNYAAYFSQHGGEVDPASPLIEAQHLPSFAVDLTRPLQPSTSTVAVMLAPQLCRVHPVPVQLWRQLRCVASFMYALESQLLTLSLLSACGTPINNMSLLQAALTSRAVNSQWEANYERSEFLGDSFLKHSVSCHFFSAHPHHPAEHLTRLRVTNINNRHLAAVGGRMLLPAIRADPFQPARMSLAGWASVDSGHLSTGVVADVVEAVVGTYYLEQGEAGARNVARWLGLPVYQHDSDNQVLTPPPLSQLEAANASIETFLTSSVPQLEHVLSYSFRNPLHLLHALTHSSALCSFNYERLEWLGDAMLDWLVTRAIFASSPHRSPGDMTACRRSMVNRDAYAVLTVQLGLHNHMLAGQQVSDMTADGAMAVLSRWGADGDGYEAGGVESLTSFKVLCDLLESVMGAVFVDCGMDLAEAKRVWDGIAAVQDTGTRMRLMMKRREKNIYGSARQKSDQDALA